MLSLGCCGLGPWSFLSRLRSFSPPNHFSELGWLLLFESSEWRSKWFVVLMEMPSNYQGTRCTSAKYHWIQQGCTNVAGESGLSPGESLRVQKIRGYRMDMFFSLGCQKMSYFGLPSAGAQVIANRALQWSKTPCQVLSNPNPLMVLCCDAAVWYCDTSVTSQRSDQQTCHWSSAEVFIIWIFLPLLVLFTAKEFQPCPFESILSAIRSFHSFNRLLFLVYIISDVRALLH